MWILLPDTRRKVENRDEQTGPEGSEKTFLETYGSCLTLIAATVVYTLGIRAVNSLAVLYFQNGRGMDYVQANFLFSLLQVAGLFSGPVSGKLSDTFGRKTVISILIGIEASCLYALAVTPESLLAIPCITFGFSSFGLLAATDAFLTDITPNRFMETIFGLSFTLGFFTQVIIPPLYGLISVSTNSLDIGFIVLSAIVPFSIPIVLKVQDKKPR
jgi:MFS family permease